MTSVSAGPFNRLVSLAARAFYDDLPPETSASGQTAVVILDALTRRNGQWIREDELAASLRMKATPIRRVLRYLEEDKIVSRDHQKEPTPAKAAATADGCAKEADEKEKVKLHHKSYWCLDYAQACDAVRYRIHRMRKKIRDELTADSRATIQQYLCPDCGTKYSALDALRLLADDYECFRCEHCSAELVVENAATIATDESTGDGGGDDGNGARKRRRIEKLHVLQRRMEEQLEPLQAQIQRVQGLAAPEFTSLRSWHKANNILAAAAAVPGRLAETELEVGILLRGADQSSTSGGSESKLFPPWMMTKRIEFTKHTGGKAEADENEDDRKMMNSNEEEEKSVFKQEYAKAFYEALWEHQMGTNIKHEDEDVDEEAGIEWEDG
ncbi:transcription initiation factor IIE subunit alpha-like [Triticum dicoccoides]|uniref:transcription initiation factor IIE subunit alpha-like n=1 Tax=Triticum dicoccoides TaxID=85692 RepID=UPI001891E0AF|nr:transcription initiation factor IIE subunit alpha-like [Triticum dicoccoides]